MGDDNQHQVKMPEWERNMHKVCYWAEYKKIYNKKEIGGELYFISSYFHLNLQSFHTYLWYRVKYSINNV